MRRHDSQLGYTLIEMMMAFVGLLAVTAIVVATLTSSTRLVGGAVTRMSGQSALRNALDVMSTELQWCDKSTLVLSQLNGSSRIDFKIPVGVVAGVAQLSSTITYQVEPSTLDANGNGVHDDGMIVRVQDGVTRVVCQRVKTGGLVVTRVGDQLTLALTVMMPNEQGGEVTDVETTTVVLKNGP